MKKNKLTKQQKNTSSPLFSVFVWLACIAGLYIFFEKSVLGLKFNLTHCSEERDRTWQNYFVKVPTGFTVHGIDVSHYSCEIDWNAVKKMRDQDAGVDFAFIRATRGNDFVDYRFKENWNGLYDAGIIRGAYHFFTFGDDPEQQARIFLNNVRIEKGDLPPVLDIEDDLTGSESRYTNEQIVQRISVWLKLVEEESGVKPIIYANANYYKKYIAGNFTGYPIWFASYNSENAIKNYNDMRWLFWQYSNEARCNGIGEKIDLNVFCSDANGLKSILKK